ncbi:hypothetical protein GCM10023340_43730 [Nocardioides marinquilinus]|uniref:Uncharacterized protein n=1 Tax=Nocardioides marinquilinus TaxID=1210400 RepID=A0ABP9Q3Z3_9ACTN
MPGDAEQHRDPGDRERAHTPQVGGRTRAAGLAHRSIIADRLKAPGARSACCDGGLEARPWPASHLTMVEVRGAPATSLETTGP